MKVKYILSVMSIGVILFAAYDRDYGVAVMGCLCLIGSATYNG